MPPTPTRARARARAPPRGHPFWLLPVSARVFTLVAKNRARGFVLPGLAHHPRHYRWTKVQAWGGAPSQCNLQVEKYIRGRIMWPLAGLFEVCWVALSRILHRSVFRFPLPVFPGVKRRPFRAGSGPGTV
ncbi:hypothetical protein HDV63DRAFT_14854 [Trichoderma sp. SZMC 28014]